MAYTYLISKSGSTEQRLVEASSPSVAIAHVAGQDHIAQRVEGPLLDTLITAVGQPEKLGREPKQEIKKPNSGQDAADSQGGSTGGEA